MSAPALRVIDKDNMDKQKALEAAIGQIERNFGKGSIMKLGANEIAVETDAISTGSPIALSFVTTPMNSITMQKIGTASTKLP